MGFLVLAARLPPSPRWGEGWGEGVPISKSELRPPLTRLARAARKSASPQRGEANRFAFSRCGFAPEPRHASDMNRHRRFHSALHAKLQQTNAGGSIGKRRFGTDDGKNEKLEAERRQRQFVFCRADGRSRASQRRGAHLSAFHHGSRQRDSRRLRLSLRPGFLGRGGDTFCVSL